MCDLQTFWATVNDYLSNTYFQKAIVWTFIFVIMNIRKKPSSIKDELKEIRELIDDYECIEEPGDY